jgi:hypothetical protein
VATAEVAGNAGSTTGTVQFSVDGSPVGGPFSLDEGTASVDLGRLARGPHTVSATYSGDAIHSASTGSVEIMVGAVPVAGDDQHEMAEDQGPTDIDVLANDRDDDGDPIEVVGHGVPGHGTVTCTATTCTYTPDTDFSGTDSFTYTIDDGDLTATATVTVTVTPVNDVPTVSPVTLETVRGKRLTFDLLASATDPDGDELTLSRYDQPAHGTLVCGADGTCTYTPAARYTGPDSFVFSVTDGIGVPTEAQATITVRAGGRGPR